MHKKVDTNQNEIVTALRSVGATVRSLASIGEGFPDLVVGFRGRNFLLEVKDGKKPQSARALTQHEALFHSLWAGQVSVVSSVDEALAGIGAMNIEKVIA